MKLIFITRKVDRGDPLTGFVFDWIEKLAVRLEKLFIICQERGDVSGLASNIEVYSLGKEKGYGKIRQGFRLFALGFSLAKKSQGFFVHMHPIYAILSWLPAKLHSKKMILWYTHKSVDFKLRIAHALVDTVLTASKESFRLPSNKVRIVGHGINLSKFKPQNASIKVTNQNSKFKIISIGRISPVKDYETLIKAVEILVNKQDVKDMEVKIYGRVGLPEHQSYLDSLIDFVRNAKLEDYIKFQGELNYQHVNDAYREADLFVNLSGTGSIDKAVLEAAASGTLVITSNEAFKAPLQRIHPDLFFEKRTPHDLAEKIFSINAWPQQDKVEVGKRLRNWVQEGHDLDNLTKKIIDEFKII